MKKILLIIMLTSIGLISCTNDEYHDIPKYKKPLINNGAVYFKDSATSKIDTFIVKRIDYWSVTSQSMTNYHWLEIYIYYNKIPKDNNYFKYAITTRTAGIPGYYFGLFCHDTLYGYTLNTISYPIQGITYSSVYVAFNDTPDTIPNKVYFTCQNGVIRYQYKDGRVYNLVNK